jgi:chromosome segregation ATPase
MTAPAAVDADRDAQRLAKLWEAYRVQEEELQEARARAESVVRDLDDVRLLLAQRDRLLIERDHEIQRLRDVVEDKDQRIRDLQSLEEDVKAVDAYKARIAELEATLAREKERLAKLFLLYEEATRKT